VSDHERQSIFKLTNDETRLADSFNHTNFYVHDIKREFQDRVKEDLTQVPDSAFAQNPNNPTYIEEDLAIQKVAFPLHCVCKYKI
jgi:hypothetical protein